MKKKKGEVKRKWLKVDIEVTITRLARLYLLNNYKVSQIWQ